VVFSLWQYFGPHGPVMQTWMAANKFPSSFYLCFLI
jgi:hypothetical protein